MLERTVHTWPRTPKIATFCERAFFFLIILELPEQCDDSIKRNFSKQFPSVFRRALKSVYKPGDESQERNIQSITDSNKTFLY